MINLIKADIYRLIRSKGIYITMGFLVALCILQSFGMMESIGVSSASIEGLEEVEPVFTGRMTPFTMMKSNDNLLYILLPIIIFISSVDFSSGTAKNVLANGVSRTHYYLAKLILSLIFCTITVIFSILIPTVIVTLLNGFGGRFDFVFISEVFGIISVQLLLLLAVTSIGVFFVFLTRSTAKVNALYMAFCLLPMLLIFLLVTISESFSNLLDYEMVMNIRLSAYVNSLAQTDVMRMIFVGILYIFLSTFVGLIVFKKCDIK